MYRWHKYSELVSLGSWGESLGSGLRIGVGALARGLTYALFTVLKNAGLLRSRAEDEIAVLDMRVLGVHAEAVPAPSFSPAATDSAIAPNE